jgi:hypothetical protein
VYELVPLHPVETIEFSGSGAPGIDEGKLRQLIESGSAAHRVLPGRLTWLAISNRFVRDAAT